MEASPGRPTYSPTGVLADGAGKTCELHILTDCEIYLSGFRFLFPRAVETMTNPHGLHRVASADQNGHLILPKYLRGIGMNLNIVRRNGTPAGIHVRREPPTKPSVMTPAHTGQIDGKGVIRRMICRRRSTRRTPSLSSGWCCEHPLNPGTYTFSDWRIQDWSDVSSF
jgi:hypothetical protein